jgi:hypothetical protein
MAVFLRRGTARRRVSAAVPPAFCPMEAMVIARHPCETNVPGVAVAVGVWALATAFAVPVNRKNAGKKQERLAPPRNSRANWKCLRPPVCQTIARPSTPRRNESKTTQLSLLVKQTSLAAGFVPYTVSEGNSLILG